MSNLFFFWIIVSFRFGKGCYLDTDGLPTCNCIDGYVGRRCEQCASGYSGNPLQPGDYCKQGKLTKK